MPIRCPFCGTEFDNIVCPYPAGRATHTFVLDCPSINCIEKQIMCNSIGSHIVGVVPVTKFDRHLITVLRENTNNWKYQISEIIKEAVNSNYIVSPRGAAICLRIVLENIINVSILHHDPNRPNEFENLGRAIDLARVELQRAPSQEDNKTSLDLVNFIKSIGDNAAHPQINRRVDPNQLPTKTNVDRAIKHLERLIRELGIA